MLTLLPVDFVQRCVSIRVVVSDVDGTLTDGGMYYNAEKEAMKRFSARDGMGVTLLQRSGIEVVLMTSDQTGISEARARKLGIQRVLEGVQDKSLTINELSKQLNVPLHEIAYIGDDVNDEAPLKRCGVSVCPSDAAHEVQKWVQYVCKHSGGNGAFRELAEIILLAQNKSIILSEIV
jgi:3-deoxy-D-manno-octulosonate 8-phosphate phosphatase (KDO 8-P phosphatase)